jgi:hypothetical protein
MCACPFFMIIRLRIPAVSMENFTNLSRAVAKNTQTRHTFSTLKHPNKSHVQTDLHDAGGSKTMSAAIKRSPSEAQPASPLDGGETTTTSLEMRVQKIEHAMHDLTSLVRQIHTKV